MDKDNLPVHLEDIPVKLYKLISGECIVAYTHELNDESNGQHIGIEEPMKVMIEEDNHYIMTPWLPFAEQKLHILDDFNVMITSTVSDDVKAHYMKIILDEIDSDDRRVADQMRTMKGNATTH
jgi:hypothetical protein